MRAWLIAAASLSLLLPAEALAWGYEGHEVVARIAQIYLTPAVQAKVEALLAADTDTLTAHEMPAEATWADRYRGAGHKETASWHFVDIELDHPDLKSACFGYPDGGHPASQGPAEDCVIDKIEAFSRELADPATAPTERLLALKFVLHFVGDLHQPLHAADNHDRGGNCVLLSLGGPRAQNLHSYWDTAVVEAMGPSSEQIAKDLSASITPADLKAWQAGDVKAWAIESYEVGIGAVYTIGSRPGCDNGAVSLPAGYADTARAAAAIQLKKAGVRLAYVLNKALS